MSIKPIDLQSLFAKMDEVSKEQSLAKEHSTLQQSQAARAQVARELEEDKRITESPEDSELDTVKDDEDEKRRGTSKRSKNEGRDASGDEKGRTIVKDQEVGRHIDLTG